MTLRFLPPRKPQPARISAGGLTSVFLEPIFASPMRTFDFLEPTFAFPAPTSAFLEPMRGFAPTSTVMCGSAIAPVSRTKTCMDGIP